MTNTNNEKLMMFQRLSIMDGFVEHLVWNDFWWYNLTGLLAGSKLEMPKNLQHHYMKLNSIHLAEFTIDACKLFLKREDYSFHGLLNKIEYDLTNDGLIKQFEGFDVIGYRQKIKDQGNRIEFFGNLRDKIFAHTDKRLHDYSAQSKTLNEIKKLAVDIIDDAQKRIQSTGWVHKHISLQNAVKSLYHVKLGIHHINEILAGNRPIDQLD